jgi:adenosine deaminase
MFNTTLTGEYLALARTFSFDARQLEQLTLNAVRAALLPGPERAALEAAYVEEFARLRREHLT